jgi:hypothetical protein
MSITAQQILFNHAIETMKMVDPAYLEKTLAGRLQATQKGSYFLGIKTTEQLQDYLQSLDWELTTHPDVTSEHTCLKAFSPVAGRIGVIRVDSLKSDDQITLVDRKGTGYLQAEYHCSEFPEFTLTHIVYAIIGKETDPSTGDQVDVLYTVHPGPPVKPSTLEGDECLLYRDEAIALGIEHAKIVLI